MRIGRLLVAFLRRDLRIQVSYRAQFLSQFLSLGMALATYVFLSSVVPGHQRVLRAYGYDYFTFVLIGSAASTFFVVGLHSFAGSLSREQATGTLEALLVTPHDARVLLVAGASWSFAFAAVQTCVYLTVGTLFLHARIAPSNLALVCVLAILCLASFSGLGLLATATLIQTKRGGTAIGLAGAVFGVLGGVLYPISVLPGWLQLVAHGLPISYGIDAVRRAALPSPDLGAIGADAAALALFTVVLLPTAYLVAGWSVNRARRSGSLAHY